MNNDASFFPGQVTTFRYYKQAKGGNIILRIGYYYRVFIKYCVFSKILIYIPDSVFSRCQCVYTDQAGRTPALQQNWQSSENSKKFKEKQNI